MQAGAAIDHCQDEYLGYSRPHQKGSHFLIRKKQDNAEYPCIQHTVLHFNTQNLIITQLSGANHDSSCKIIRRYKHEYFSHMIPE